MANVTTDGFVEVTETIELRFGSSSGRHGLERTLITRETGRRPARRRLQGRPASGSAARRQASPRRIDISDQGSGRNTYTRIRVGSANRTVTTPTATYVLTYRVQGLLRSFAGYDELYWDVDRLLHARDHRCEGQHHRARRRAGRDLLRGDARQPGACVPTSVVDANGVAQYAASNIPTGELLTVGAKITSGLVTNNTPIQVENADTASARDGAIALGRLRPAVAAVVPFFGWLYLRRRTRDFRYAGMPPGTFPPADRTAEEVPSDPRMEIPVSFAPPGIPVADAGLLVDGETQVRDTTATLVGLAVSGAIQLRSDGQQQVRLIDPDRAPDPVSRRLLDSLFPDGTPPGHRGGLRQSRHPDRRPRHGRHPRPRKGPERRCVHA